MSGGGSGGSSATQQFTPPSWTTSYQGDTGPWQGYLTQAINLANRPYQAYAGQTIAALQPAQQLGMDMATRRAIEGSPDLNAARQMAMQTSQGQYLNNPYLNNEYTQNAINFNADAMARAAQLGTMAQTDTAAAQQGAFGGSAYEQQVAANQAALAGQVGNMANQMQLGQMQLGSGDYRSGTGQMLQAGQLAQGLSQDDWTAAQALTGVGDAYRSYQQDLLNQGLNSWNASQQYPLMMLDVVGNALARSSGNVAGGSTSMGSQNYSASPLATMLGLGALGYGGYSALNR